MTRTKRKARSVICFRKPKTKRTLSQLELAADCLADQAGPEFKLRRACKHKYPSSWDDIQPSEVSQDFSIEAKLKGKVLYKHETKHGWLLVMFAASCTVELSDLLIDKAFHVRYNVWAFKLIRNRHGRLVPKGWLLVDGKNATLTELYRY